MKVVARFTDAISASIAQGMLRNYDIPSMIGNQAMSTLYPLPMGGVWDVTLLVNDSDFDKALELLKEHNDIEHE